MHNISAEHKCKICVKAGERRGLGQRSHPWLRKREGPMPRHGRDSTVGAYCPQALAPQAEHPLPHIQNNKSQKLI